MKPNRILHAFVSVVPMFLMLLALAAIVNAAGSNPHLDIRFFNGWKFFKGNATGAQQPSFSDAAWQTVSLPHTVNVETVTGGNYYLGYCWYRKSFVPSEQFRNKKVFLEFEGAMQVATVWLNGTSLGIHYGGYSGFVFDITSALKFGQTNIIAVQLNNTATTDVPPGIASPDYRYYGGLYRDVWLHVTDNLHITDPIFANTPGGGGVFVTYPTVSAASATVLVKTNIKNENTDTRKCVLQTTLLTPDGKEVQTVEASKTLGAGADSTFNQTITVVNPKLWWPDTPNLYIVRSRVLDDTLNTDSLLTTIGIRTIQFTRANGFVINGTRQKLMGTNRHIEYPFVGNAVPPSGQYRDAKLLKEGGFPFVRMCCAHPPKTFVDACDKLGVTVMASIPGWQYTSSSAPFLNNTLNDIKTLVRLNRNHPSIILWEVVHNESSDPKDMVIATHNAAHAEYPGDQMYTCGEEGNGIVDVFLSSTQHGVRNYAGPKPCAISECGDWEYGGASSSSRQGRGNGEIGMLTQVTNHLETLNLNLALPWFTADGLWSGLDYCGFQVPLRSGAIDIYRLPKFSYYFHQSQRNPAVVQPGVSSGPMVYIASHWTPQSSKQVKVYSNCEQVTLSVNGRVIATQSPDKGTTVANLPHPPFTFATSFQPGTLLAEGKIGGTVKASHQVKTPGAAAKLLVVVDTLGRSLGADGADFSFVYTSVLDANGVLVPNATNSIKLTVAGPGAIVGTNPQAAEGGIASMLVQTTLTPGLVTITATSTGLTTGTATVMTVPVLTYEQMLSAKPLRAKPEPHAKVLMRRTAEGRIVIALPLSAVMPGVKASYRLYNALGKTVAEQRVDHSGQVSFDAALFAPGTYWGQLVAGEQIVDTRKIAIIR